MITKPRLLGKIFRTLAITVFTILVGACATISTGSHYDEHHNFVGYHTFSWIAANPYVKAIDEEPAKVNPLTQLKIERALRAELESRGYVFVDDKEVADFVLGYTVGTRQKVNIESYPSMYRGYWGWHSYNDVYFSHEYREYSYDQGTLGVDVFDGKSHQPVWHGWATKTVTASDREDPSQTIIKAVALIFDKFPY